MAKSTGVHDIGGLEEEFGPIDTREYGYQLWEMQVEENDLVTTLITSAYYNIITRCTQPSSSWLRRG